MNTTSSTPVTPRPIEKATIVREYGPFPFERVHGVTSTTRTSGSPTERSSWR